MYQMELVVLSLSWAFIYMYNSFVWFDSLCPSQQPFSYVGMGLPGLNQYKARINVSCSWTQGSDASEARTHNPSVLCQALYHWATALLSISVICDLGSNCLQKLSAEVTSR